MASNAVQLLARRPRSRPSLASGGHRTMADVPVLETQLRAPRVVDLRAELRRDTPGPPSAGCLAPLAPWHQLSRKSGQFAGKMGLVAGTNSRHQVGGDLPPRGCRPLREVRHRGGSGPQAYSARNGPDHGLSRDPLNQHRDRLEQRRPTAHSHDLTLRAAHSVDGSCRHWC